MTRFYLMGGFGNLCFQKLIVMELEKQCQIKIDESLISHNFLTKNILRWNIHPNFSHILFKNRINTYANKKVAVFSDLLFLFVSRITGKVIFGRLWLKKTVFVSPEVKVIAGYCQETELFNECRNNIPNLSKLVKGHFVNKRRGFVIHYRGTDSVWAKGNDKFYREIISKHIGDMEVTVVTDDIVRAKNIFSNDVFIVSGNLLSDFSFLINSTYLVVAPSTLSWWAGLLSVQAKKIYVPSILSEKLPDLSFDERVRYV